MLMLIAKHLRRNHESVSLVPLLLDHMNLAIGQTNNVTMVIIGDGEFLEAFTGVESARVYLRRQRDETHDHIGRLLVVFQVP